MTKLKVVGTSIGNLEDITIRALKTLFTSDIVLAEDTRVYLKFKSLLKERLRSTLDSLKLNEEHRQILISYRDQNHDKVFPQVLEYLQQEKKVSLVSDSGMPAISDPGYKLIRELIDFNAEVEVIPGPTAFSTALIFSGLPTDKFSFLGFLPRKEGKAIKLLQSYLQKENTVIIYESPFRILKTLESIKHNIGGNILVAATSELTKFHEQAIRGDVSEVVDKLKTSTPKGEWAICLRLK